MVEILGYSITGSWLVIVWLGVILGIFIIHLLLQVLIKRVTEKKSLLPDVVNSLRLLTRFGSAVLMLYASVFLFDLGEGTTLSLSIFLGSVVSFASMYTIQNFVAGIFLILTKPFKVNDFVKIGKVEGVVTQISLNYTSILNFDGILEYIPNKSILGTTIINYDQKVQKRSAFKQQLSITALKNTFHTFDDGEITRYTFVWGAPLMNLKEMKRRLNMVCEQYTDIFGYTPEFVATLISHRFEFYFVLKADDPITILRNKTKFLDEISLQFH